MASVLAVLALHSSCIFEELSTKRTAHDGVELLGHKLVTVLFLDFLFALAYGTFSVESEVKSSFAFVVFRCLIISELTYLRPVARSYRNSW